MLDYVLAKSTKKRLSLLEQTSQVRLSPLDQTTPPALIDYVKHLSLRWCCCKKLPLSDCMNFQKKQFVDKAPTYIVFRGTKKASGV